MFNQPSCLSPWHCLSLIVVFIENCDKGADLGDRKSEVILQANKDAKDKSAKTAAQKNKGIAISCQHFAKSYPLSLL
jgi:hypothetical protein